MRINNINNTAVLKSASLDVLPVAYQQQWPLGPKLDRWVYKFFNPTVECPECHLDVSHRSLVLDRLIFEERKEHREISLLRAAVHCLNPDCVALFSLDFSDLFPDFQTLLDNLGVCSHCNKATNLDALREQALMREFDNRMPVCFTLFAERQNTTTALPVLSYKFNCVYCEQPRAHYRYETRVPRSKTPRLQAWNESLLRRRKK